jgi:enoyl-CoA hydratase
MIPMKPIDYSMYTTMTISRRGPGDSVLDVQMKAGANGKLPTAGHAGHEELSEIWRDVGKDDSVRCVVLRGEGLGFSGVFPARSARMPTIKGSSFISMALPISTS